MKNLDLKNQRQLEAAEGSKIIFFRADGGNGKCDTRNVPYRKTENMMIE